MSGAKNSCKENYDAGFTLLEVLTVVVILGIVLSLGVLSYANIRKGVNLDAAAKQVASAMERAKISSRQENVDYQIIFYASGDVSHPNTFEFLHAVYDEAGDSWSMQPVDKSVGDEKLVVDGGHYYIEISSSVVIASGASITFHPTGTMMNITTIPGEGGKQTVTILMGDRTGYVSIDAQGKITRE